MEDLSHSARYLVRKHDQDPGRGKQIDDGHGRHDAGGRFRDTFQTSQGDGRHCDGQDHSRPGNGDAGIQFRDFHDGIDLGKGADAKIGNEHTEESKYESKRLVFFAHAQCDIVHRSAGDLSFIVHSTEFTGQQAFGIFRGHAEERRDPHPEDGSRSAGFDCRGYADDVSRADRSRQCRAQRLERVDIPFFLVFCRKDQFQCFRQMYDLQEMDAAGQEDARTYQQYQERRPPDKAVDAVQ